MRRTTPAAYPARSRLRPAPLAPILALCLLVSLQFIAGAQSPQYNPLRIVSVSPSSVSVLSGQTVVYTVTASGGSPSSFYTANVADQYGNLLSSTTFPFTSGVTSSIRIAENNTGASPSSYVLTFTLGDAAGDEPVSSTAVLTVAGAGQTSLPKCGAFQNGQFSINVTPTSASIQSGPHRFQVSASGATCAYGLTVVDRSSGHVYNSAKGITSSPYNLSVNETNPGTYLITFLAKDYAGRNASASALLTYSGTAATQPSGPASGGASSGMAPAELQNLCGFLRSVMLVLGVALLIFGGAVFVGTWAIPGRAKGAIHRYGMWALVAGIICLAVGIAAPYIPNPIAMPGAAAPIC